MERKNMDRENDRELRRPAEPSDREELVGDTAASERLTDGAMVDPGAGRVPGRANERAAGAPGTEEVEEHEPGP